MFGKKIAFVGCHTDDEMIAAGTLHRLVRQGCEVHVVAFSPAAIQTDRSGGPPSAAVVLPEWHRSLGLIGVSREHRHFVNFLPETHLENCHQRVCQWVFDFCEREKPDTIFTLSPEDENTTHAVVGTQTERVTRGRVPTVIRCQFPWNHSIGRPNLYVTLTEEDMQVKRGVIESYVSQQFRYRYGDMLLHFVVGHGMSVKRDAAEVFEVIRSVV